jgi:hypothetical protein
MKERRRGERAKHGKEGVIGARIKKMERRHEVGGSRDKRKERCERKINKMNQKWKSWGRGERGKKA